MGTRACAWESQQPHHHPGKDTSRTYLGGKERVVSTGSSLKHHLGTVSERVRQKYFFRSCQCSAPAPIAGMQHFPGQDTCFLLAKPKEPLQLQLADKA